MECALQSCTTKYCLHEIAELAGAIYWLQTPVVAVYHDVVGGKLCVMVSWGQAGPYLYQGVSNNYETDLLRPIMDRAAQLAGVSYSTADVKTQMALKVGFETSHHSLNLQTLCLALRLLPCKTVTMGTHTARHGIVL